MHVLVFVYYVVVFVVLVLIVVLVVVSFVVQIDLHMDQAVLVHYYPLTLRILLTPIIFYSIIKNNVISFYDYFLPTVGRFLPFVALLCATAVLLARRSCA